MWWRRRRVKQDPAYAQQELDAARAGALQAQALAEQERIRVLDENQSLVSTMKLRAQLLPNAEITHDRRTHCARRAERWSQMSAQLAGLLPPVEGLAFFEETTAHAYTRLRQDYTRLARFRRLLVNNLREHISYWYADLYRPEGLRAQLDLAFDRLDLLERQIATVRSCGYSISDSSEWLLKLTRRLEEHYDAGQYGSVATAIDQLFALILEASMRVQDRAALIDADQALTGPLIRRIMEVERHRQAVQTVLDDLIATYGDRVDQDLAAGLGRADEKIQLARATLDQVAESLTRESALARQMALIKFDYIASLCKQATQLCNAVTSAQRQFDRQADRPQDQ